MQQTSHDRTEFSTRLRLNFNKFDTARDELAWQLAQVQSAMSLSFILPCSGQIMNFQSDHPEFAVT